MLSTNVKADGIPDLVAGTSGLPRMDMIDVASCQGNLLVSDYQQMKKYGVKSIMVKLTEGDWYTNDFARTQINNAIAAGLHVGAYHYATFDSSSSAKKEAHFFARTAKSMGLSGNVVMADDLEDNSTKRNAQANAVAFSNELKSQGYANNILYTYDSYVSQTGLNLSSFGNNNIWMASWR
ncbi:GH25 family lysozyme [Weissella confusa]|uniref:GH25 family lysozyme n=1 Tax=Weissella confusa TaxID=1583 RepID=UPI0018F23D08|nr:GH25 family lysozyme [Weissella confusa]MBJ7651263.1 hypothetical protein [Weissella confusa]